MPDEDLIESTSPPKSARRRRAEQLLRRPAVAAALLVVGLLAGSVAGYIVGHSNPRVLSGIYGYSPTWESFIPLAGSPFDQTYGGPPIPPLTLEDVAALGENVTRQFSVLSGRSAIPVICGTGVGRPGTSGDAGAGYPSTVFRVDGGELTELVWPLTDEAAASGALQTLAFQAQECPTVPNSDATIATGGVLAGIGDEYAVFHRTPTVSGPTVPGAAVSFATVVLVRVGADMIELSFTSAIESPGAEARCLAAAAAAVQVAAGG